LGACNATVLISYGFITAEENCPLFPTYLKKVIFGGLFASNIILPLVENPSLKFKIPQSKLTF
jgi:hypothetical protein